MGSAPISASRPGRTGRESLQIGNWAQIVAKVRRSAPRKANGTADDWDAHWDDYASSAEENPAQRFRRRVVFDLLERDGPPMRLLDIGAGQGDLLAGAVERWPSCAVAGVELSGAGVAEARRKAPSANVVQADLLHATPAIAARLGWASHAVCSEVLEHVEQPAVLLRNARPLLAPGCRIVITVPGGPRSAFDKHIGHRRHFTRTALGEVLADAGLTDIRVEAAGFPAFNLYKLVVLLRGKRLIEDAKAATPSGATTVVTRAFDRLFDGASGRGRFGWQLVATATSP